MEKTHYDIGRTCWKLAKADEACVILDAENYYKNLYVNLCKAKQQVIFLGWDFHSRLNMIRPAKPKKNDHPVMFGKLLKYLVKKNPDLNIHIVAWDFATVYLPMREMFQKLKFKAPRVNFIFDGQHPLTSAHHQKIVVIDNQIAYCGGLDLTSMRWDSVHHNAEEPRRKDFGKSYAPFHDIMVGLTGQAAKDLGDLARERVFNATGKELPVPGKRSFSSTEDRFSCGTHFGPLNVAISRTVPNFRGCEEVREVETLYCEQIRAAETYIYIENQYLTAGIIVEALKESLERDVGPSIMIILPEDQSDVLSRMVINGLESTAIKTLRAADKHKRLFAGFLHNPDIKKGLFGNIHSKLISIDDRELRIGSANLNNRSMGLDTECDITLLSEENPEMAKKFRQETAHLIAHHYGCAWQTVLNEWEAVDLNFPKLVQKLNDRCVRQMKPFKISEQPITIPALNAIAEGDSPSQLEKAADKLLAKGFDHQVGFFFRVVPVGFISTATFSALLAISDRAVDYSKTLYPFNYLLTVTDPVNQAAVIAFIGFTLAGMMLVPYPLLLIWSITTLGKFGLPVIIVGTLVSTILGYGFGRMMGKKPKTLPGRWLPMVDEKMRQGGFWNLFWARAYPFAPYPIISYMAGRNRMPFRKFFLGSIAGITPYLTAVFLIHMQLLNFTTEPSVWHFVFIMAMILFVIKIITVIQHRFSLRASAVQARA